MNPPIFATVNVSAVQALLKAPAGELRFYAFGRAPQNVAYPYAVWQLVGGAPENFLDRVPDADSLSVQVDVYARPGDDTEQEARTVAAALRDALEPKCYITGWRGESIDPDTGNFRIGFVCDWIVYR